MPLANTPAEEGLLLRGVEDLAVRLGERNIDQYFVWRCAVLAAAEAAKKSEASTRARDFAAALSFLGDLAVRLAGNGVYPSDVFEWGAPAVARLALSMEEFTGNLSLLGDLEIRLKGEGIYPSYTNQRAVPALAKVAKTAGELLSGANRIGELEIRLKKEGADAWRIFAPDIRDKARSAGSVEGLCTDLEWLGMTSPREQDALRMMAMLPEGSI